MLRHLQAKKYDNSRLFLLSKKPHSPHDKPDDDEYTDFFGIFGNDIHNLLSQKIPEKHENETPNPRSKSGQKNKDGEIHTKHSRRDGDKVSDNWDEPPKESVEPVIFEKERLRLQVFFMIDEEIFPVLFYKRFPDPLSEDIIVHGRPEYAPESSRTKQEREIESVRPCQVPRRDHHRLRWNRKDTRFHRHEEKNGNIRKSSEKIKNNFENLVEHTKRKII